MDTRGGRTEELAGRGSRRVRLGGTSEQELGRTNRNAGDSGGTGDSGMGETSRVTRGWMKPVETQQIQEAQETQDTFKHWLFSPHTNQLNPTQEFP